MPPPHSPRRQSRSSAAKLYYPVTYKKREGALIASEENLAFYDDEKQGKQVLQLQWSEVTRITTNVASSPSPLLKVTTTIPHTFKFDTRTKLDEAKADAKNYWKAAHNDESMNNYDDEDFTESKREDGDDLLFYQSMKSAAAKKFSRRASTGRMPRIESGESFRPEKLSPHRYSAPPQQPTKKLGTMARNSSSKGLEQHRPSSKKLVARESSQKRLPDPINSTPPQQQKRQSTKKQGTVVRESSRKGLEEQQRQSSKKLGREPSSKGFSKASQIQLLSQDRILLPRHHGSKGHYRLGFSNFSNSQAMELAIVPAGSKDGGRGIVRTIKLEDLLQPKPSREQARSGNSTLAMDAEAQLPDDEEYRVSKQLCLAGVTAVACGVLLLVFMAVALVILSVLLWKKENASDDNQGFSPEGDDFYAGFNPGP